MAEDGSEPTGMDHAAWMLVAELLNSGAVLSGLFRSMRKNLTPAMLRGEEPEAVMLEMMVGSALPALRKAGADDCLRAAGLIRAVHDRVMDDLRLARDIAARREPS